MLNLFLSVNPLLLEFPERELCYMGLIACTGVIISVTMVVLFRNEWES